MTVSEGDGDTTQASFSASLSAPSAKPISVVATTGNGSATAGEDFGFATGTLTFAPGATTASFDVDIVGDLLDEPDETFTVELSAPTNATIDDGLATGTITDDDPAPSISVDDVSVTEGDSGTTPATFGVTLSAPSGRTITVDYGTVQGSALAGSDYTPATRDADVRARRDEPDRRVDVLGDTAFEADESFRLDLSDAVNATLADPSGTATIENDDGAATVDVSIVKTSEFAGVAVAGDPIAYRLVVRNLGSAPADTVQVTDSLPHPAIPEDARWCEVIAPATTCDPAAGEAYDSSTAIPAIDKLMPGTVRTYRIGYTLAASAPSGPMSNTASVTTLSVDTDPVNDASTVELVVDRRPIAAFTVTPATPVVGTVVRFDASTSTDDSGIVEYAWSFGDGQEAAGQVVTHVYQSAGDFQVELVVTDEFGVTGQASATVVVGPNNAPPAGRVLRGTISQLLTYGPGSAPSPTSVPVAGARVLSARARAAWPRRPTPRAAMSSPTSAARTRVRSS